MLACRVGSTQLENFAFVMSTSTEASQPTKKNIKLRLFLVANDR